MVKMFHHDPPLYRRRGGGGTKRRIGWIENTKRHLNKQRRVSPPTIEGDIFLDDSSFSRDQIVGFNQFPRGATIGESTNLSHPRTTRGASNWELSNRNTWMFVFRHFLNLGPLWCNQNRLFPIDQMMWRHFWLRVIRKIESRLTLIRTEVSQISLSIHVISGCEGMGSGETTRMNHKTKSVKARVTGIWRNEETGEPPEVM